MSMFIMITLSITIGCNLIAASLSYLMLATGRFTAQRIQGQRYRSGVFRSRLPLILFNLTLLMSLTYLGLSLAEELFFWDDLSAISVMGILGMIAQFMTLVLIDDAYFYLFHRSLHERPWLYRHIHKIHHRAFAPLPLEYIYVHPLEWMVGAGGIPIGLTLIYITQESISVWPFWVFAAWRNLHEVDIHSGLISKWSHRIPLLGTTEHHDLHHMKNSKGNYSSTFTLWDQVMGTQLNSSSTRHLEDDQ